jgi:hypothetical protein
MAVMPLRYSKQKPFIWFSDIRHQHHFISSDIQGQNNLFPLFSTKIIYDCMILDTHHQDNSLICGISKDEVSYLAITNSFKSKI